MKNNTNESKVLLEKALQSLPQDNALQGARYHLKCAINEITHIEIKRKGREVVRKTTEEMYKEKMNSFFVTPSNAKTVLDKIESMISEEKKKIEDMQKKTDSQTPNTLLTDTD